MVLTTYLSSQIKQQSCSFIYIYIYIYIYIFQRKTKNVHVRIINRFPSCYGY